MAEYETKDSGQHAEYASGMRRDTQDGKPRFGLVLTKLQPYEEQMLTRYAALLARGAAKYEDRNWEAGDSEEELERAKDSLLRHTMQLLAGETDEDHAAAVWFNTQAVEYFRWRIAQKVEEFKAAIKAPGAIQINTGLNPEEFAAAVRHGMAQLPKAGSKLAEELALYEPPKVVVGQSQSDGPWLGAAFQRCQEVWVRAGEKRDLLRGRIDSYLPQSSVSGTDQYLVKVLDAWPNGFETVLASDIQSRTS